MCVYQRKREGESESTCMCVWGGGTERESESMCAWGEGEEYREREN